MKHINRDTLKGVKDQLERGRVSLNAYNSKMAMNTTPVNMFGKVGRKAGTPSLSQNTVKPGALKMR